jgi:hypothetical protein
MADETAEEFDRVNPINLRGVWACMSTNSAKCGNRRVAQ